MRDYAQLICTALVAALLVGCASVPQQDLQVAKGTNATFATQKTFRIAAEEFWRIELPSGGQFDASGLVWDERRLLVVADGQSGLFEIHFGAANTATLKRVEIFTSTQMSNFRVGMHGRFDLEGLARDTPGRIYACEESSRSIFRFDPVSRSVEQLQIDWAPVQRYFSHDKNASFEGIAVSGDKLWLANERERARVIELNLETLQVTGDFAPAPSSWGIVTHYSDICWFKGRLYLLLRHHQRILEVDPATRNVVSEYDYSSAEEDPQHAYRRAYPTGTMEGLAVDDGYFWLVTDNNGLPRQQDSNDRRPTLFKLRRPVAP